MTKTIKLNTSIGDWTALERICKQYINANYSDEIISQGFARVKEYNAFIHKYTYYAFSKNRLIFVIGGRQPKLIDIDLKSIIGVSLKTSSFLESIIMLKGYKYIRLDYYYKNKKKELHFYLSEFSIKTTADSKNTQELHLVIKKLFKIESLHQSTAGIPL